MSLFAYAAHWLKAQQRVQRMKPWAFAATFALAALWSANAGAEMQCRASRELLELGSPLEIAKTAVAEERELRIVALGSSSTQGYGASNPQYAYPAQLKMQPRAGDARHPGPRLEQGRRRPGRRRDGRAHEVPT